MVRYTRGMSAMQDPDPETGAETPEPIPFFNRELSWLAFNGRVLEEAYDSRHPLLERVKFLSIFGSNLDEFYMIRVSALQAQRSAGISEIAADGLTPAEALDRVAESASALMDSALQCRDLLFGLLAKEDIYLCPWSKLSQTDRDAMHAYFHREIFPILTPLAVDPGHPFPHISNLSLNLAVVIRDDIGEKFARVKVPASLPRLVPLPQDGGEGLRFAWLEEVVAQHLEALFPGYSPEAAYPFRVTRDADIEIREAEAEDLLRAVATDIERRHFSFVTRLEVTRDMPEHIRRLLIQGLEMDPRNLVATGEGAGGQLGLSSLNELLRLERPDLRDPVHVPRNPAALSNGEDIFSVLRKGDVLLHHPYDSFAPVLRLVQEAARDTGTLAIKQTLYRVGSNSPLVPALMEARDADTQVAVLVELKARFDEQNNIEWARRLDEAGVHVVYGLIGLKTHAKALLVVRKEADGSILRYVHLGTGNYNATTARLYTDFGLMTCDADLAQDISELFNYLTGYSRQREYRKILVAPLNLRHRMAEMIRREIRHAEEGRPARIIFQMNALVDPEMISLLYAASRAGVAVDLIIRGICCLVPGLPGWSENIRVVSIVGRFLEHCRVFWFENGGESELWMGSADLMPRNLDRRVEVVFPVESPRHKDYVVRHVLGTLLGDTSQARRLLPDGRFERLRAEPRKRRVDAQSTFLKGRRGR